LAFIVVTVVPGFVLLFTNGGKHAYFSIAGLVYIGAEIVGLVILWKIKPLRLIDRLMMSIIERVSNRIVRLTLLGLPVAGVAAAILLASNAP
jgi:hypothetical protein